MASRDIGQMIRPIYKKDIDLAIATLVDGEGLTRTEVRREALKRFRGTGQLRSGECVPGCARAVASDAGNGGVDAAVVRVGCSPHRPNVAP